MTLYNAPEQSTGMAAAVRDIQVLDNVGDDRARVQQEEREAGRGDV
jgi:hypothetical protein